MKKIKLHARKIYCIKSLLDFLSNLKGARRSIAMTFKIHFTARFNFKTTTFFLWIAICTLNYATWKFYDPKNRHHFSIASKQSLITRLGA